MHLIEGAACANRFRNEILTPWQAVDTIAAQALFRTSAASGGLNEPTVAAIAANLAMFFALLIAGESASLGLGIICNAAPRTTETEKV
jgi:hypothetical protein